MSYLQPIFTAILWLTLSSVALADSLPTSGNMLTLEGLDPQVTAGGRITLSLEDLQEMPVSEFETSTIWTDGVHRFTGVALADLFAALGVEGSVIAARAVNDYEVNIPMTDAIPGGPIVAYHMNGAPMLLRDKGPFWIVYPYDSDRSYRSETIYSRSIWQLSALSVHD